MLDGKRTLEIEYWPRTEECKELKWLHFEKLDALCTSREDHIYQSILVDTATVFEPNMFPYDTPPGIEHWTLWSRDELTETAMEILVEEWLETTRPDVLEWNYDDNADRSIDIYHIHLYFKTSSSHLVAAQVEEGNDDDDA